MQTEKELLEKIEQTKEQANRSRRNHNKAIKDLADYYKKQDKRLNLIAREVLIYWLAKRAVKHHYKNLQADKLFCNYLEIGLALATDKYPKENITAEDMQTILDTFFLEVQPLRKYLQQEAEASNGTGQHEGLPIKEKTNSTDHTPPDNQEIPMQENNVLVDASR